MQAIQSFAGDLCCLHLDAVEIREQGKAFQCHGNELMQRINRLASCLASSQTMAANQWDILADDLKTIDAFLPQIRWTEAHVQANLPLHLKQGLASCLNLLNSSVPAEVRAVNYYHGGILRLALAKKHEMAPGKTPQECVRTYCLNVLKAALKMYPGRPLYLLRESSSIHLDADAGLQSVVLTITAHLQPENLDHLKHYFLEFDCRGFFWRIRGNGNKFSTLDAIIENYVPASASPLCSPSNDDVYEYIISYMAGQESGYRFNSLAVSDAASPLPPPNGAKPSCTPHPFSVLAEVSDTDE